VICNNTITANSCANAIRTSEEVQDSKVLKKMVDRVSENNDVKDVSADGEYDSKNDFQYLYDNGIESIIT